MNFPPDLLRLLRGTSKLATLTGAGTSQESGLRTFRDARFYLRNSNTTGFVNIQLDLGNVGDMPIGGNWDGKP